MQDEENNYRTVDEKKKPEYTAYLRDSLIPGIELKVERSVYNSKYDISDLVQKTPNELQAFIDDCTKKEQNTYQTILAAVNQWEKQAAITQRYIRALTYVKTPESIHTDNKWTTDKDGGRTISNKVYKVTCNLQENTRWNRWKGKGLPPRWRVSWALNTNSPVEGMNTQIAGQVREFHEKAAAEKYLNGRISAYAKLFTETSPPIPRDYAFSFYVSSTLLFGYQIEGEERQAERPSVIGQLSVAKKQDVGTQKLPKYTKKQFER